MIYVGMEKNRSFWVEKFPEMFISKGGNFPVTQGLEVEGELPEKVTCYEGVFYNYFSIGMLT